MGQHMVRMKKNMEDQLKELQQGLDDAEQVALKGGKKHVAKLESRVREMEAELDTETRRASEGQKTIRKLERKVKEARTVVRRTRRICNASNNWLTRSRSK